MRIPVEYALSFPDSVCADFRFPRVLLYAVTRSVSAVPTCLVNWSIWVVS